MTKKAREAAEDYSKKLHEAVESGDADAIADNLRGWAFSSAVAGFEMLSRPGVTLTPEQQEYVRQCIAQGELAQAQGV